LTKLIKCQQCSMKIGDKMCEFAVHKSSKDGEEYIFCCEKCAEKYEKEK